MKYIYFSFVIVFICFQYINGQSHNMEWGTKGPNDRMVFREIAHKEHEFMKVVTEDVKYTGHPIISYIKATDQYLNDNGGYITITDGGVKTANVTFHIKSKRNHGFNFILEVYSSS